MFVNHTSLRLVLSALSIVCISTASTTSAKTAPCKRGHKAKVIEKGYVKQATFRKFKGDEVCVTFDGANRKNRKLKCLAKKSVRCTGSKQPIFKPGQTVQVRKNKKTHSAKIKSYKRGKYCVSFTQSSTLKDACLRTGKVRLKIRKLRPAVVGKFVKPGKKPTGGTARPGKGKLVRPAQNFAPSPVTTPAPAPDPAPPADPSANGEDPKRCYKMRTGTKRSECMIALMSPGLQPKIKTIIKELRAAGWKAVVHESRRDRAQQEKKCRDGFSQTMCSKHMCDTAADIIDKRYAWNISQSHAFWKALGKASKKQGLEWGGDWKSFKDVAHIQTGKCTLSQLRKYGLTSCDCPK